MAQSADKELHLERTENLFVRVPASQLPLLGLTHLASYTDAPDETRALCAFSFGLCPTGGTEWSCTSHAGVLTLAWDWVLLSDAALIPMRESPPRSNLLLTGESGDALAPEAANEALFTFIEGLDWQAPVRRLAAGVAPAADLVATRRDLGAP